jgi:hypothetical protein
MADGFWRSPFAYALLGREGKAVEEVSIYRIGYKHYKALARQ